MKNIAYLLLHDPEFNFVLVNEWNDDISMFHCRFYKVIVRGLDETVVLHEHIFDSSTSLSDVALNYKKDN